MQVRGLSPVLLRKVLQRVLDHLVMLSSHIDPIGLTSQFVPAFFPRVRPSRTTALGATPSVSFERTRRIYVIPSWDMF